MKTFILCLCMVAGLCLANEAETLYAQGIDALRAGQLVPAAKLLAKASEKYELAGDDAAATNANAALFWAKKKLNLQQCNELVATDAKAAKRADEVVVRKVEPVNADKELQKAISFASAHQDDQLLIAIRMFDIASRYKGTDAGFKAMDLSLAAMQKIPAAKAVAGRKPIAQPEPATPAQTKPTKQIKASASPLLGNWVAKHSVYKIELSGNTILMTEESTGLCSEDCIILPDRIIFKWASGNCAAVTMQSSGKTSVLKFYYGYFRTKTLAEDMELPNNGNATFVLIKEKEKSK